MTGRQDRRTPRYTVTTFAWYCVIGDCKSEEHEPCEGIAHTIDLSSVGVGLHTPHPVPPGTYLFVELTTPAHAISLVGRVAYAHKRSDEYYQIGVAVAIIPPNDRGAYEALLRRAQADST
jgi:hypothetical protein